MYGLAQTAVCARPPSLEGPRDRRELAKQRVEELSPPTRSQGDCMKDKPVALITGANRGIGLDVTDRDSIADPIFARGEWRS
jgi:hypothetical protein